MATSYDHITEAQAQLIRESQVFFVASAAPDLSRGPANQGPVNLSPKGGTPLHVIDANRVAYLDYTGSGNETARHAGGPMTLMVMSMSHSDAAVVRLYGTATVTPIESLAAARPRAERDRGRHRAAEAPGHRREDRRHSDQLRLRRPGVRFRGAADHVRPRTLLQGNLSVPRFLTLASLIAALALIAGCTSSSTSSSGTAPTATAAAENAATSNSTGANGAGAAPTSAAAAENATVEVAEPSATAGPAPSPTPDGIIESSVTTPSRPGSSRRWR